MKLSKFVKTVKHNDDIVLYNTINQAVIELPRQAVQDRKIVANIDDESIEALREAFFLSETDSEIVSNLPDYLINDKKLFISVELNLSCNLRCPYCYQAGTHDGKVISDDTLDSLVNYVKKVYEKSPFEDLFVKILGGEPTLVWKKFHKICKDLLAFTKSAGIKFHLLVDTNCTLIDDLLTLEGYDSLLFTIPLSYKECHDKVRFDAKGNGTYEKIIENINIIHQKLPDAKIVIRYNVDGDNRDFFKPFLDDIREKLIFKPLVSVNYTAELNGDPNYKNTMSYVDFVEWSSSQAIDDLIMAEMPVTISPIVSVEECQYRSKYSFKLFSDGTVGSCAMSFFDKDKLSLQELLDLFAEENAFSQKKQVQTIVSEPACMSCKDIFMCGGTNRLPCIKALDPNLCENKIFNVNLEKFIKKYLDYVELGKNELFVVFENGESYR